MRENLRHPEYALCLGGADCVWDDVLAWEAIYGRQWDGFVIAANDIGSHWPRELDHWATLHPHKLEKWKEQRVSHGLSINGVVTWSGARRRQAPQTDEAIVAWAGGSSGLLTVQVAWALGCTRAVLCGIPITATAHFAETTERFGRQWAGAAGHWRAWNRCKDKLDGWVRSMSGRTKDLLGSPTLEWLLEGAKEE